MPHDEVRQSKLAFSRSFHRFRSTNTALLLGLGILVDEDTFRGIGSERRQSRSIQEDGRAIRTDNPIALAHVEIDMRMIVGRRRTDARELPRTDLDLADAQIVLEFRVAGSLHAVLGGA